MVGTIFGHIGLVALFGDVAVVVAASFIFERCTADSADTAVIVFTIAISYSSTTLTSSFSSGHGHGFDLEIHFFGHSASPYRRMRVLYARLGEYSLLPWLRQAARDIQVRTSRVWAWFGMPQRGECSWRSCD